MEKELSSSSIIDHHQQQLNIKRQQLTLTTFAFWWNVVGMFDSATRSIWQQFSFEVIDIRSINQSINQSININQPAVQEEIKSSK
jgi:hypothetical protein